MGIKMMESSASSSGEWEASRTGRLWIARVSSRGKHIRHSGQEGGRYHSFLTPPLGLFCNSLIPLDGLA